MSNIHRTARGINLDLDRLKTINERTVAVGNAGVNARGDLVKGGKIIKSREEITRENYNIRGNNIVSDNKVNRPVPDVMPHHVEEPVDIPESEARGGLANAINKTLELTDKLAARKKI